MASSWSLLSCDAMFFSVRSQFFVKNAFFGDRYFFFFFHKFLCIFHNSKTIQGIWMDLYRDVDPDDQAPAHMWHNSSLLTFLVISLCIFSQIFVYALELQNYSRYLDDTL